MTKASDCRVGLNESHKKDDDQPENFRIVRVLSGLGDQ